MSLQQLLQFAQSSHNNTIALTRKSFWSRNFASLRDNISLVGPISAASNRDGRIERIWRGNAWTTAKVTETIKTGTKMNGAIKLSYDAKKS
jgi:hypothetical protein